MHVTAVPTSTAATECVNMAALPKPQADQQPTFKQGRNGKCTVCSKMEVDHYNHPLNGNKYCYSRGICRICGEEVTTFDLRVKVAGGYLHQACEDVSARGTDVEAGLCIVRDSDLRGLVEGAARAVASTPEGLPAEFMSKDDQEVLSLVRAHHARGDNAAVVRVSAHCTEYLHTRSEVSSCRADVERALAVGSEEEIAQSAVRRDEAYRQHVAAAQGLLKACSGQVLETVAYSKVRDDHQAGPDNEERSRLEAQVKEQQVLVAQYARLRAEKEELVAEHDVLVSAYQKLQSENAELEHQHQVLEHPVKQNQSAQSLACRLCELLGDAVIDTDDLPDTESAVGQCISAHDEWVRRQMAQSQELRGNVKEAMGRLGTALQTHVRMLLDTSSNGTCSSDDLVDTRPRAVDLLESIAAQERWMWCLAKEYEEAISPMLQRAAWVAVMNVNMEPLQHAALMEAVRGASVVVKDGAHPDERLMQDLKRLSRRLRSARSAITRDELDISKAQDDIEGAKDDCNEEARAEAEKALTCAKHSRKKHRDEIRLLAEEQQASWSTLYRLAVFAYPDLPAKALQEIASSSRLSELSLVDPRAARLLAPSRSKEMYEPPAGSENIARVSWAGKDSRNNVFHAVFGGREVCLKQFVLGSLGDAGATQIAVRTLQREINSVAKLAHDRVIKPALFFLQAEDGRLCAYVEYPWYTCGSMQQWIDSLAAPEAADARARVRVVLWDVIKALEHVHYHGIVHCDVKQANVLVELGCDGQHRGILADFDLSKDLQARKMASLSVLSIAPGARGTPGCLTMAPEISQGHQPDAKADVFSFGGMVLQVLFREEADRWQQGADSDRWIGSDPQLSKVQDGAARSLLAQVLQREKDKRPTSSQVVSHSFFSADARAINLMQTLEHGRVHLERQQAAYAATLNEHRRRVEEEQQSLAEAKKKMLQDLSSRQARLDLDRQSMERKESELADAGKRNQDVQEQLQAEERRLQAEREKLTAEMRRQEQELRRHEQALAQKRREEQERLAVERQDINTRKMELAEKERQASTLVRVPAYWKNKTGYHREPSTFVKEALRGFMVQSAACCNAVASRVQVVSAERIENEHLWQMYQTRKSILRKGLVALRSSVPKLASKTKWRPDIPSAQELDADMNEFYLFHCTSAATAGIIAEHGFDQRVSALSGRYGAGNYFAVNACKCHQYSVASPGSGLRVMLVCRVVMGLPYCAAGLHKNARRAPDNPETPGRPFDSVFAEAGVISNGDASHNEYVIYDQSQVYPEYVVHYRV